MLPVVMVASSIRLPSGFVAEKVFCKAKVQDVPLSSAAVTGVSRAGSEMLFFGWQSFRKCIDIFFE